jgi:adenine-specific DNA-methyltransferase
LLPLVIAEFMPRFITGGDEVLYRRDSPCFRRAQFRRFERRCSNLASALPAVVIGISAQRRFAIVDLVTIRGVIDERRRRESRQLFGSTGEPLIFITGLESRAQLAKGLPTWGTVAWIAEEPEHLIHFGPPRLFEPYPKNL